jgi:hypothetical protein
MEVFERNGVQKSILVQPLSEIGDMYSSGILCDGIYIGPHNQWNCINQHSIIYPYTRILGGMRVTVRSLTGVVHSIELPDGESTKILTIKQIIQKDLKHSVTSQSLYQSGKLLTDDATIGELSIEDDAVIFLVLSENIPIDPIDSLNIDTHPTSEGFQIFVSGVSKQKLSLALPNGTLATVKDVKDSIKQKTGTDPINIQLYFNSKELSDTTTLGDAGVENEAQLQAVAQFK